LALAGIELDRKSLAELAVREPEGFIEVVKLAQDALPA
jgi:ribosomal protein L20